MRIWKIVFSVLTVVFGSIGLMKLLPYDITLPIMFVFMGLVMSLKLPTPFGALSLEKSIL